MNQPLLNQKILRFVIQGQVQSNPNFPLPTHSETILGRDPSCNIALASYSNVSRRHAAIQFLPSNQWVIRDFGSANGTYVNRQAVRGEQVLKPGDRIQLAQDGAEFQFDDAASVSAVPLQPATKGTIEERYYRIEVSPTKLLLELKQENSVEDVLIIFLVLFGLIMLAYIGVSTYRLSSYSVGFVNVLPPVLHFSLLLLIPIGPIYVCIRRRDLSYLFDLEANQLVIMQASFIDRVFSRRRHVQQYNLQEIVAVRLQERTASYGSSDFGFTTVRFLSIQLDRVNKKSIRVNHVFGARDDRNPREKVEELANMINRFLRRS